MTVSSHLCGEAEHYTARCILAIYKKAHIKDIYPFTFLNIFGQEQLCLCLGVQMYGLKNASP